MTPITTGIFRPVFALLSLVSLAACANVNSVAETYPTANEAWFAPVERLAVTETTTGAPVAADPRGSNAFHGNYNVTAVNVNVPETLRVSEANRYIPRGDIVWREDPIGNRHEQVQAIVTAGLSAGASTVDGARPVIIDVQVSKFHALTEKARYTVGGVHAIQFTMQMRDAVTGVIIAGPKFIKADFDALGGQAAIQAEAKGITQKVRIIDHLAFVMQAELTRPEGFIKYNNGIIGALNQIQ